MTPLSAPVNLSIIHLYVVSGSEEVPPPSLTIVVRETGGAYAKNGVSRA